MNRDRQISLARTLLAGFEGETLATTFFVYGMNILLLTPLCFLLIYGCGEHIGLRLIPFFVLASVAGECVWCAYSLRHEADLSGADLSEAYLSGADLSGANLSRANLSGANLSGANLSGARYLEYAQNLNLARDFDKALIAEKHKPLLEKWKQAAGERRRLRIE